MMISNLPSDLIEEIFSKIPLKFMGVVRSTCREWDTLCRNRNFTKTPIEKAFSASKEGESPMVMLMDYSLYLMSVVFDVVPSIETKCRLTCLDEQVKISHIYYSEGLLLCVLKDEDTSKYSRLVVWNPYSGKTRWIEPRYKMSVVDKYKYALGYVNEKNKSCRNHRILRFYDDPVELKRQSFCYEIYDFESGLWTSLNFTPCWRILFFQRGVSLNGNTYWCATGRNSDYGLNDHIICIDFTRKIFGQLLPLPFSARLQDHVNLSCVRDEKLAVSLQHNLSVVEESEEINIWITTKIEAGKVSWTKLLKMNMGPDFCYLPISPGNFFINEEKKVVMGFCGNYLRSTHNTLSFIGEDGYFKVIYLGERLVQGCRSSVCPYIPSSVQINQPAGDKWKNRNKAI